MLEKSQKTAWAPQSSSQNNHPWLQNGRILEDTGYESLAKSWRFTFNLFSCKQSLTCLQIDWMDSNPAVATQLLKSMCCQSGSPMIVAKSKLEAWKQHEWCEKKAATNEHSFRQKPLAVKCMRTYKCWKKHHLYLNQRLFCHWCRHFGRSSSHPHLRFSHSVECTIVRFIASPWRVCHTILCCILLCRCFIHLHINGADWNSFNIVSM